MKTTTAALLAFTLSMLALSSHADNPNPKALSSTATSEVAAQEKMLPKDNKVVELQTLRNVAPNRGQPVPFGLQLKANGSGSTKVVCCTTFNSSIGGKGCATFPDVCPDNTFTMKCGKDGCW